MDGILHPVGAISYCTTEEGEEDESGTLPMFLSDVKARHDKMVGLVEAMLKLHKALPKAKTPHEQESARRTIAATDKQIYALVLKLPGLTEERSQDP